MLRTVGICPVKFCKFLVALRLTLPPSINEKRRTLFSLIPVGFRLDVYKMCVVGMSISTHLRHSI